MSDGFKVSKGKLPPWSKVETAYIAGIVDGEGCIGVYRRWNRGYFIQLTIANTNRKLLDWLSKVLHANAVKHLNDKRRRNKPSFSVTVDRVRAYKILLRILPYLKVKTPQALLAIRFKDWQDTHKVGKTGFGHRAYGKREHKVCEHFVRTSRTLNQKGVSL